MRTIAKRWALSGVVLAGSMAAAPARAEFPRLVVPNKGHRYVMWLDPIDNTGTKPPLTQADQLRYCGALQGYAERVFRVTNGRHRIFQVQVVYGDAPMVFDIHWNRFHGTPHATGLNTGLFEMFDRITLARHKFIENPDGTLGVETTCPPGLTIHDTGEVRRETCLDANGNSPLQSVEDNAFVLTHEMSHSHYGLPDEYVTNTAIETFGARVCSNPDWLTSIMADFGAEFWCDVNTHLSSRFIAGPFSGTIPISTGSTDVWSVAKNSWANLNDYDPGGPVAHVLGSTPTNENFTRPVGPWQPLPSDEFCVFTGTEFPNAVLNDVVVVVDKSGSMGYRFSPLDVTAFDAAFAAGLGQYNRTPPQKKAGVTVFDSAVSRPIPYSLRGSSVFTPANFNLAAGGSTNLCGAIDDTAAQVRTGQTSDAVGHMVLLTDGRPTVAGCNTAEAVRDAAIRACQPTDGSKPVAISALAFGDADVGMLQQIADICGGVAKMADGSGGGSPAPLPGASPPPGPGDPPPLNIQVATSRLAYQVRGYGEAMYTQEPLPSVFEKSFDVSPGTQELEAVWMGENASFFIDPDVSGFACDFANYTFELVDPAGNLAGVDPVPPFSETRYRTRTKRVVNPAPGTWRMRVRNGEPCVVGNSRGLHVPEVAMFAKYRHHLVRGHLDFNKPSVAANEPVLVTASLEIGPNTYATNITAAGKLVNGTLSQSIPLFDDGTHGDAVAGDGVYSTLLNSTCSPTSFTPGPYRFVAEFQSNAAQARSVAIPDPDVLLEASPSSLTPPRTVSLVEERLLNIDACNNPFPGCGGVTATTNLCRTTQVIVPGTVTVPPGGSTTTTVTLQHCPVGTTGVTVGVGPGIVASNVQSTYNSVLDQGTVTFTMTARADATAGQRPIKIFWGRQRCDTTGSVISVCSPVPATVPAATLAVCAQSGAQRMTLTVPNLAQSCVTSIQGRVVRSSGVALSPPVLIAADGTVTLPLGTHDIEWTVTTSAGATQIVRQTLYVSPAVAANGAFVFDDRSRIVDSQGHPAAVANSGSTTTEVGVTAQTGDIVSRASVFVRDRGIVHGSITTAGTVTRQNQTTIDGVIRQRATVDLSPVANPPVTFPANMGSDVMLEPNQTLALVAGTRNRVTIKTGARLILGAGDYLFDGLDVEPSAMVEITPTTRIFLRSSFIYRGAFVNAASAPTDTFLAYYGSAAITLESNYRGRLFAASAQAILGDGDSHTFAGAFFARSIELRPDVTLTCQSSVGSVAANNR